VRARRSGSSASLAALAAALVIAGCGGDGGDPAGALEVPGGVGPERDVPALCTPLRVEVIGRIGAAAATELSGLVLSRSQPGVLWTHNDSGDRPRLLAVSPTGRLLADLTVQGAESFDWEDIAAARGSLLVGDIGDNLAQRPTISVYRVNEPRLRAGSAVRGLSATRFDLRYPDGPRDAEALLRDPNGGKLVIVQKRAFGGAGVYVADRVAAGRTTTLRRAGRLTIGAVTAGDVAADGRTIALRTYDRVLVWVRRPGESVAAALQRRPCVAREGLLSEGQGETLALFGDGRAFYTVPEGAGPAIRVYAPR
jgi:hypothetical protein